MTVQQVAELANVTVWAVYKAITAGYLTPELIFGRKVIPSDQAKAWAEKERKPGPKPK